MNNVYLSQLACDALIQYLSRQNFRLHFLTEADSPVYDAVKTHADIHMCRLGVWNKPQLFTGDPAKLKAHYPGNIIYNAVCTGEYFIHNLKHTDPDLMQAAEDWHTASFPGRTFRRIHVPQGYTRCTCLPVDEDAFITSDAGIAGPLSDAGADVLLIRQGHILFPGFDYGFLGGCAGHFPGRILIFNGDLSDHPDFPVISSFLQEHDVRPVFFRAYPLTDIGSILTV